jgi:hypothetical protein
MLYRKSGVVFLHHLRGTVGIEKKELAQKEAPTEPFPWGQSVQ